MNRPDHIPPSVRELLRHEWQHDAKYSAFETSARRGDRLDDPSYYHFRPSDQADGIGAFSYQEVVKLAEDGFAKADDKHATMNEHIAHALSDFLGEVSAAWKKCKQRIDDVS